MVKGISRQVIMVHSPDPKLFEQAIFILKDGVEGVTEDALLREANAALRQQGYPRRPVAFGALCASAGAALTAALWLLCALA